MMQGSDYADMQADSILHWVHMSESMFSPVVAHNIFQTFLASSKCMFV